MEINYIYVSKNIGQLPPDGHKNPGSKSLDLMDFLR